MRKISFVIPCYNSANTITQVVDEIRSLFRAHAELDYEIIMVVDCSPDNVYQVIENLCMADSRLVGLELARNFGQHAALMCGYAKATGDVVVSLDDDGQTPVESVFDMLTAIQDGADVVFGDYISKRQSIYRHVGSRINDLMSCWLLDKPRGLKTNSFFAARRFVIDQMVMYENAYPYLPGLLLRVTRNMVNVRVNHRSRKSGRSGYTFVKLLRLWVNGFTAFSVKPLRLATLVGFFFAIAGFIWGLLVVGNKILHPEISAGYSSIMSVLIFVGGVLMLMLGLVGEYIGRIYICINKSPQYVVRNVAAQGGEVKDA